MTSAHWRDELMPRLQPLRLRSEREDEIIAELSDHLDDHVRELVSGGADPKDARRIALADLDAPGELARQLAAIETRSPYRLPPPGAPARGRWLRALWQDASQSVRALRRTPGFTLTVVGALAITIGPTTAILSVGNWLLWRPLPGVADPDRLAVVWFGNWDDDGSMSPKGTSDANIEDLERASQTIAAIAGWQESTVSFAVEGAPPRRVGSAHATADFLDVLGVRPMAGRTFTAEEDQPPFGAPVALLSDRLARTAFGSAEDALGQTVLANGRRLSVIGVMPTGFAGASPLSRVDVWYPSWTYLYVRHFGENIAQSQAGRARGLFYTFIVRLAPGATFDAMQVELDVLVPALAKQYPDENKAFTTVRARVFPGLGPSELARERYHRLVNTLLLVGGVLLLLGCANVANLLISRGARRQHERGVRVALGASRGRLVRLLLVESCVLAVAGAAAGVAVAVWLKEVIQSLLLPGLGAVLMDVRVLGATLAVSVGCGLLAGLAPAWIGSTVQPSGQLGRGDLRTSTHRPRLRAGLAVGQLALSLALVTNALLLVATLWNLASVDVGFDPQGVTAHDLDLSSHGYDTVRAMAYDRDLLDRLSSDPAIEAASLSSSYPPVFVARIEDPAGGEAAPLEVYTNYVTADHFRVLRISLLGGRSFGPDETLTPARVDGLPVILDEVLARRLFGDANPLGRRVRVRTFNPAHDLIVAGVTRNAGWRVLVDDPDLLMYLPFAYDADFAARRPTVLVRSDRTLREIGTLVQSHGSAIDPSLPFAPARPLTAGIEHELSSQRTFAWVLSLLGGLGFALAGVGLFGLLAQLVGERTREFGIRMAIGGSRAHVFGLVIRQATWIALFGAAAGLGLAVLGSRFVEAQLFGLSHLEPSVYLLSAASLAVVVFLASMWPARSATRIEPVEALRSE